MGKIDKLVSSLYDENSSKSIRKAGDFMHRYLSYIGYLLCILSVYGFANLAVFGFPMVVQFSLGLIIWGIGQILLELKKITAALVPQTPEEEEVFRNAVETPS